MAEFGVDRFGRKVLVEIEDFLIRYRLEDGSIAMAWDIPGPPRAAVMERFDAHYPEGVEPDPPPGEAAPPDLSSLFASASPETRAVLLALGFAPKE